MSSAAGFTVVGTWLFTNFADKALEVGAKGLWRKIQDKRARLELAEACARSIEAAASTAPALGEDLRSASFLGVVVVPMVRALLERPSDLFTAETLADRFVGMFVARFSGVEGVDAALMRIFQTERGQLRAAFERFLDTLKGELYASEHWREAQHLLTTEDMASSVGRIETLLEEMSSDARASAVDLDQARSDARTASAEMIAWPSEIHGVRLETPALDRVVSRILDEPAGRTLLVGEAGTGKSALLARLAPLLEEKGVTVFAVKADQLPASVTTLTELAAALGVRDGVEDRLVALASERPVALLLDQLDAVSDVMDRQSSRMRVLLQLVHRLGARARAGDAAPHVHVLVSSRPFEAAHDARFQMLKAETLRLDLLDEEQVASMLERFGLPIDQVGAAMRQTLRRPFALKLFVDILARGDDGRGLTPTGLLDAWLATADLGGPSERRETTMFLNALATEMVETETLWRPADAFELDHPGAVQRAEAAGLVVRSDGSLGFSHQSWLDDFQAKAFRTGGDLASYTWARQDGLFIRASVLRAMERLRIRDARGYETALRALLDNARTRRHIRHLLVDIVSTARDPLPFELGWVDHWIRTDRPLALRALRQITPRWAAWRDGLREELPAMMSVAAFQWPVAFLLAEEVRLDADHVARLVDRHWSEPAHDQLVFRILEQSDLIGLDVTARLRTIFSRTQIEDHQISNLVRILSADGRHDEAATIVAMWLEGQAPIDAEHPTIHGLEKLAKDAPLTTANRLLPWFVRIASRTVGEPHTVMFQFPRSHSLPHDFELENRDGSPFTALETALAALAEQDPAALWRLLEPITSVEIDQVQELVASGLAKAGAALSSQSLDYLLADTRRLQISHIITTVDDNTIGSIQGWHSQELVRSIGPHLDPDNLARLRDAIEAWSAYTDDALEEEDFAEHRRANLDAERLPLLDALPRNALASQRAAEVDTWRARERRTAVRKAPPDMAGWVGPPMTHEEMADATDAEIIAVLDEFHDDSGEQRWTRPISRSGGVRELSRALGAMAKSDPGRGFTLAAELMPGRHERAAGELIKELSGAEGGDAQLVLDLVIGMDARGFRSQDWRGDAASAMQTLAQRLKGLDNAIVSLMEGWLETDPARIAEQVTERLQFQARNRRDPPQRDAPTPMLFGSMGGLDVLPHENFTILAGISNALLCREIPDSDGWAAALERHVERPEDPEIWSSTLAWRGKHLAWADADRASALFARIQERFPEAWRHLRTVRVLWQLRKRVPDEVLIHTMIWWMSGHEDVRQASAEFLTAAQFVDPDELRYRLLFDRLDRTDQAIETGVLFSAGAAWRDRDPALRSAAHAMIMAALGGPEVLAGRALARALSARTELIPDQMTRELLATLPEHPTLLAQLLNHTFSEALQGLLLYPGFDGVILGILEAVVGAVVEQPGRGLGMRGDELVHVAIALQRSDGPLRARAMDVYERLLDAAVYGAEEAAQASLSR